MCSEFLLASHSTWNTEITRIFAMECDNCKANFLIVSDNVRRGSQDVLIKQLKYGLQNFC